MCEEEGERGGEREKKKRERFIFEACRGFTVIIVKTVHVNKVCREVIGPAHQLNANVKSKLITLIEVNEQDKIRYNFETIIFSVNFRNGLV